MASFYKATTILTGHHHDDVIETCLLQLERGNIFHLGLPMIEDSKNTIPTIRPLYTVHKKHILAYAKTHNLIYSSDSTNLKLTYKRNEIRTVVLPTLKDHSHNTLQHLLKLFKIAQSQYEKPLHNMPAKAIQDTFYFSCQLPTINSLSDTELNRWVYAVLKTYKSGLIKQQNLKAIFTKTIDTQ